MNNYYEQFVIYYIAHCILDHNAIMSCGTLLGDLESIAASLQDDKVTVRKKAADKLNDLLQNATVISLLCNQTIACSNSNESAKGLGGSLFTWNNLYRATFRYMLKEADKLQKDQEKSSKGFAFSQSQG